MTPEQADELRDRWHNLSMVCFSGCREDRLCSACRGQDSIKRQLEEAGYHLARQPRRST